MFAAVMILSLNIVLLPKFGILGAAITFFISCLMSPSSTNSDNILEKTPKLTRIGVKFDSIPAAKSLALISVKPSIICPSFNLSVFLAVEIFGLLASTQ